LRTWLIILAYAVAALVGIVIAEILVRREFEKRSQMKDETGKRRLRLPGE